MYRPRTYPDSRVHGAHLGPVSPRWAPCFPHEPCYQGTYKTENRVHQTVSDRQQLTTKSHVCCDLFWHRSCLFFTRRIPSKWRTRFIKILMSVNVTNNQEHSCLPPFWSYRNYRLIFDRKRSQNISFWYIYIYIIQIKIGVEYWDMLPRPKLVCQEPELRLIGRSPGVPDKSSWGLGSMSRYSAQILVCFITYIFLKKIHSSVGLVGNFAGPPVCTVPSAIVHCNQNEAGHQTIKAPSMPCWGAAGPSKHSLAFKSQPGENDRQNGWNLYQ